MRTWIVARAEDAVLLALAGAGLVLFLAPLFLGSRFPQPVLLFSALVAVSAMIALAVALQTHRLSTRLLTILAALVAIDATLRLVIVIGLLGFSPIFFLVIAGGFVMGPSFGFATGALTLLLSAVLTAGLGPWLPYQMLAAGWVGMGAGYIGRLSGRRPSPKTIAVLSLYGFAAGFAYGILLDLWEWPLLVAAGSSPLSWAPGIGLVALVRRFGGFYLATSLVYDAFRAAGNLLLIVVLGSAVISALERFRRRFLTVWTADHPVNEQAPVKISADVGTPT
ncbi:MAG: energy-coupling factor transport system substrate-specific component [Chloroflexota bacterium]|jgi:energy-coupling factor transport system substrate-specific component|nr:energy-coupling factor transport system substrate-specific component [Chloroflexota bacterium]